MSKQRNKHADHKQQKITSMLSHVEKNISNSSGSSRSRQKEYEYEEKKKNPYDSHFSDEEEENLPLSFKTFDAHSNLLEVTIAHIKELKGDNYKKYIKNMKCVHNYKMAFYKGFYTRPEKRCKGTLKKLELSSNAPLNVRHRFYDVPVKYQHRLNDKKKKKHKALKNKENEERIYNVEELWEEDIRNPQPTTSKRARKLLEKCQISPTSPVENQRTRVAVSLLHEKRVYFSEAEKDLPIRLTDFQNYLNCKKIVNKIIRDATVDDPEACERYLYDENVRERIIRNYYHAFYESPETIRLLYAPIFKACPLSVKQKILETVAISKPQDNNEQTAKLKSTRKNLEKLYDAFDIDASPKPNDNEYDLRETEQRQELNSIEINCNSSSHEVASKRCSSKANEIVPHAKTMTIAGESTEERNAEIGAVQVGPLINLKSLPTKLLEELHGTNEQQLDNCQSFPTSPLENQRTRMARSLLDEGRIYLAEAEKNFPTSLANFERYVNCKKIVDQIILDATLNEPEACERYLQDQNVRERIKRNYYHAFYESPETIRLLYAPIFKACPLSVKQNILETVATSIPKNNEQIAELNSSLLAMPVEGEARKILEQANNISVLPKATENEHGLGETELQQEVNVNADIPPVLKPNSNDVQNEKSSTKTSSKRRSSITNEILPQAKRIEIAGEEIIPEIEASLPQMKSLPNKSLELEGKLPGISESDRKLLDKCQIITTSSVENQRTKVALSLLHGERIYSVEEEKKFPTSLVYFQRYVNCKNIVDQIIRVATVDDPKACETYLQDQKVHERILRNYYYAFYESPDTTRLLFAPSFKACPLSVKENILQPVATSIPKDNIEQIAELNSKLLTKSVPTEARKNLEIANETIGELPKTTENEQHGLREIEPQQRVNILNVVPVNNLNSDHLQNATVEQSSDSSSPRFATKRHSAAYENTSQSKRNKISCADEVKETAQIDFLQLLDSVPSNALELESTFPVTFHEFITNTNCLFMIKELCHFNEELSKEVQARIATLAHKIYLKFYTDEEFRQHESLQHLYFRSNLSSTLLKFPRQTKNETKKETKIFNKIFLQPVENLQIFEASFSITLEQFKMYVNVEKLLNSVLNFIPSEDQKTIISNPDLCDIVIQNCYVQFLVSRLFGETVQIEVLEGFENLFLSKEEQIKTTNCERIENAESITAEKQKQTETILNDLETEANLNEMDKTGMLQNPAVQNDKNRATQRMEESTQQVTKRLLMLRKKTLKKKFLQRFIKGKVAAELEDEVLQRLSQLVESKRTPRKKVTIQSVEVLRPASDVNYTLDQLYFQSIKKPYTIGHMLKNSYGNKLSILNAILEMTFPDFQLYTELYDGQKMYQNLEWAARFYKFTFVDRKIWPPNLYIPLNVLIDYLFEKCKPFKPLTLDCISPKLLHYADLSMCTNFSLCAYENNLEKLQKSTAEQIQKTNEEFYKRCWLNDTWNNYTPSITDENIRKRILEFETLVDNIETPISNKNAEATIQLETSKQQHDKIQSDSHNKELQICLKKPKPSPILKAMSNNQNKEISRKTLSNKRLANLYDECETCDERTELSSFNMPSSPQKQKIQASPNLFSSSGSTATSTASQSQPEQALEKTNCNSIIDNNDQNQSVERILMPTVNALNANNATNAIPESETLYEFSQTNDQKLNVLNDPLGTQNLLKQLSITSNDNSEVINHIKTPIKQEPLKFLDKLYFSFCDDNVNIKCEPINEEIVILDDTATNITDELNDVNFTPHAEGIGAHTQEIIDNACTQSLNNFCETQQSPWNVETTETNQQALADVQSVPQIAKQRRKSKSTKSKTNKVTDFVPQLTHEFRPLPLVSINKNVVPDKQTHMNKEPIEHSYSISQDLASDMTLFNNPELLQRLMSTQSSTAANTVKQQQQKQVNDIENLKSTISLHPPYKNSEFLCYRRILRFNYFNALTRAQVIEYTLPVVAAGQTFMQTLIHDGQRKTLLYGDNLAGLFSYYKPDTLKSLRCLLSSLDEFHYNANEINTEKLSSDSFDDLRKQILLSIFQNDVHIAPSILSFDNNLREYASCIPLRDAKRPADQPVPLLPATNAIEPHIFKRLCEPYKPLNQANTFC